MDINIFVLSLIAPLISCHSQRRSYKFRKSESLCNWVYHRIYSSTEKWTLLFFVLCHRKPWTKVLLKAQGIQQRSKAQSEKPSKKVSSQQELLQKKKNLLIKSSLPSCLQLFRCIFLQIRLYNDSSSTWARHFRPLRVAEAVSRSFLKRIVK